jgi:hypothetical protein
MALSRIVPTQCSRCRHRYLAGTFQEVHQQHAPRDRHLEVAGNFFLVPAVDEPQKPQELDEPPTPGTQGA